MGILEDENKYKYIDINEKDKYRSSVSRSFYKFDFVIASNN